MLKSSAFTLIEISVVILIIMILIGIGLFGFGNQLTYIRDLKKISTLNNLANNLTDYFIKVNQYPPFQDSAPLWVNLKSAFISQGIYFNFPTDGFYEYIPCTDFPTDSFVNHFILRTKLEQEIAKAPQLYQQSYNSSTIPEAWNCSPSIVDCSASLNYYCLIQ